MNRKQEYENLMRSELSFLGCNRQLTDKQLRRLDRRDESIKSQVTDYELELLSHFFYSVVHRLIKPKPRNVIEYEKFDYKGNDTGISNLKKKAFNGEILTPHLSKQVFDVDQSRKNDPMLNEWGIYHFHIPEYEGSGSFVNRSSNLLFVIVTQDEFILLDVQPHSDETETYEPWVDTGIISKIERYYPQLLTKYFVGNGRQPLTFEKRKNLRAINANTSIITDVGNEYNPPGFGTVAAGLPINVIRQSDKARAFIQQLEAAEENDGALKFDENYNLIVKYHEL